MYNGLFKTMTPLSAYWLGFIIADGSVSVNSPNSVRFGFGLKLSDEYAVQQLKQDTCLENKLYYSKKRPFVTLGTSDKNICCDLMALGVVPRKTRLLTGKEVPTGFEKEFILGLFDGDGSIGLYKRNGRRHLTGSWCIYGHGPFLRVIQHVIERQTGIKLRFSESGRKNEVFKIGTRNHRYLLKLSQWLYSTNCQRFLIRKRRKFEEVVNYIRTYRRLHKYGFYINKRPYENIKCIKCGCTCLKRLDKGSHSKNLFCSRLCCIKYYQQKRQEQFGSLRIIKNGRYLYLSQCPSCGKNIYLRKGDTRKRCSQQCKELQNAT